MSTEAPVTKTSNKTKNANGRGSTYLVTKANGKKVRKAATNDVNGKRRVKTFKTKCLKPGCTGAERLITYAVAFLGKSHLKIVVPSSLRGSFRECQT